MISFKERSYLYWLCHVPVLGAVKLKALHDSFGSFREIYNIEGKELEERRILKPGQGTIYEQWKKRLDSCQRELEGLEQRKTRFLTPFDPDYPQRLLSIHAYPMGLFVKGRVPAEDRKTAAIIGSRACTSYGSQMAAYLAEELSRAGVQIISGLAWGIDGAGHQGALRAGGDTYAVLGCGIHTCYPKENYALFEKIPSQGGILTEYVPSEPPRARNFPMRNRIISGLSDAILVLEAREKSGSLITAGLGLEQGKEIFALPGRVSDPLSVGCNRLIQDGAAPLLGPEDVLEYFKIGNGKILRVHENNENGLAKKEKMVYSCLDLQPKNLEKIVLLSGLSVSECLNSLIELELKGCILQTSHQYYCKKL